MAEQHAHDVQQRARRTHSTSVDAYRGLPTISIVNMADAAWAELQAGESGARDKAWDRILKKNAVAKKAKKKRPPKRWEPRPHLSSQRRRRAGQAAGAARDAVALLRRLAPTVQQTAAEDSQVRGEGLDTLGKALTQNLPDATVAELLHSLCQPLLRRFRGSRRKITGEGYHRDGGIMSKGQRSCSRTSRA